MRLQMKFCIVPINIQYQKSSIFMSLHRFKRLANGPSVGLLYHAKKVEYVACCQLFNNGQAASDLTAGLR